MIFIVIFVALAVSMATMSGTNIQLASNQHKVGCALASAASGLEVKRYWLSQVMMPSSTPPANYLSTVVTTLQNDLDANSISNITLNNNGSISPVALDAVTGQTFSGQIFINPGNPDILQVYTTGGGDQVKRTIGTYFDIEPYEHPIFNYGLATKGPLNYAGNPTMTGVNSNWEADIYVESASSVTAVAINGNTNFDGNIMIGNPSANVDFQGDVLIAGDQGQAAIDNHVFIGVDPVDFPVPDTARFLQYATGADIDSGTDTSDNMILTKRRIVAGTNPTFEGNIRIEGILFIEQPNRVTFNGNVDLQGMIVADGNVDEPGTNSITFFGNFETNPYPPRHIRSEIGSSLLAPGFSAEFAGNFASLGGVMAVSGAYFSGNVNAIVEGTIINYSEDPMVVEGNPTFRFDRAGSTKVPAGFDTHRVLTYNPSSYRELAL
jgi:signal peptidase I